MDSSQEELYIAGDSNTGKIRYSSLAAHSHKCLALETESEESSIGDLINQERSLRVTTMTNKKTKTMAESTVYIIHCIMLQDCLSTIPGSGR